MTSNGAPPTAVTTPRGPDHVASGVRPRRAQGADEAAAASRRAQAQARGLVPPPPDGRTVPQPPGYQENRHRSRTPSAVATARSRPAVPQRPPPNTPWRRQGPTRRRVHPSPPRRVLRLMLLARLPSARPPASDQRLVLGTEAGAHRGTRSVSHRGAPEQRVGGNPHLGPRGTERRSRASRGGMQKPPGTTRAGVFRTIRSEQVNVKV